MAFIGVKLQLVLLLPTSSSSYIWDAGPWQAQPSRILSGISGAVVCQQSFVFLNRERHPLRVNCPSQEHNTLLRRVDSDQDFSKLIAVNDNILGKI